MIVELKKVNEKIWNAALSKAESEGTIFQSTYWAKYLQKTFGDRPIYIVSLDNNGNIEGLLLAIESCYAKHSALTLCGKRGLLFGKLYKQAISPVFHKMVPSIVWENGPIILSQSSVKNPSHKKVLYRKIVEKIVDEAQKRNCYKIKFARPTFFNDNTEIFSSLGFRKKRMGNILVDLDQPLEDLWKRIENKTRRLIRRATDKNDEIAEVSKIDELREFYDIHLQTSKRANTKTYPFSHFGSLWNHFSPLNKAVVFIARFRDEPLGALILLMHNKIIHIYAGGDSDYARSHKMQATRVLLWHIMKWAHERGFKYFDLAGVELYKIDAGYKKALGIYRFKSKWGGKLVEYHDYEKLIQEKDLIKLLNRFLTDPVMHI